MLKPGTERLTGVRIPDLCCLVLAAGNDTVAVRAKSRPRENQLVLQDGCHRRSCSRIPDPGLADTRDTPGTRIAGMDIVAAGGNHEAVIGAELGVLHRMGVWQHRV